VCYEYNDQDYIEVPCTGPFNIHSLLPVMLIVIVLYLQRKISTSKEYNSVVQDMDKGKEKAGGRRKNIIQQFYNDLKEKRNGKSLNIPGYYLVLLKNREWFVRLKDYLLERYNKAKKTNEGLGICKFYSQIYRFTFTSRYFSYHRISILCQNYYKQL
jgi:hypothetical protein